MFYEKNLMYCYECSEECRKGLLSKIKPYGFTEFVKRYGMDKLLECLEKNEQKGIVYHREGINGDYDDFEELKCPQDENRQLIKNAKVKIRKSVEALKAGKPIKEGLGIGYRLAGFFGQRLYFGHKTNYSDKLWVNEDKCVGCGKCEKICPMKNIKVVDKKVIQNNQCTMCYRCINNCPKQTLTLLGKEVVEQSVIEKYLD